MYAIRSYYANFGSANVTILPGNGDGTFGVATNLPLAASLNPTSIVAGDFNRDGKQDLAVAVGYRITSYNYAIRSYYEDEKSKSKSNHPKKSFTIFNKTKNTK